MFVDFWAEWCGPCRMVAPIVDDLSVEYYEKVKFVKINIDKFQDISSLYNIFSIPTILFFNGGKIIEQQIGSASQGAYKEMIEKSI